MERLVELNTHDYERGHLHSFAVITSYADIIREFFVNFIQEPFQKIMSYEVSKIVMPFGTWLLKPSEFTKIISKHNSEGVFSLAGFLLCTSKLSLDEESAEYIFNSTGIKQNHAYAILNSVVFENHRLVQIGNTHACDKWKELHKEWNSLHYFYNSKLKFAFEFVEFLFRIFFQTTETPIYQSFGWYEFLDGYWSILRAF